MSDTLKYRIIYPPPTENDITIRNLFELQALREEIRLVLGECNTQHYQRNLFAYPTIGTFFGGSAAELHIDPVSPCVDDLDIMYYNRHKVAVFSKNPAVPSHDITNFNENVTCFIVDLEKDYPSYARLREIGELKYNWDDDFFEFLELEFEPKHRPESYYHFKHIPELRTNETHNGPAKTIEADLLAFLVMPLGFLRHDTTIDYVECIRCHIMATGNRK